MNYIHPTAIIGEFVILGDNNYIGPFCYITGNTSIGNGNRFEAYCSIGTPAQDRTVMIDNEATHSVIIGNNNVFREYCTVHTGTVRHTTINNDCIFLVNTHISHDSIIENNVTIGNNTVLGGHTYVMEGANIGLNVIIHQYSKIGSYSMIGMGGVVTKRSSILPCKIYIGNPVKYLKYNTIGVERSQLSIDQINKLMDRYEKL